MDIRDIQSRNTGPADEARSARRVGASSSAKPAPDRSSDHVSLSERAQALQETRRAALDVPEVRSDRVNAVRAKLADGSLTPDPERIARALLAQGLVRF
jgi:flagellar biosynthesis anti-sigma factor FlgM